MPDLSRGPVSPGSLGEALPRSCLAEALSPRIKPSAMRYAVAGISAVFASGVAAGLVLAGRLPPWLFLVAAVVSFVLALAMRRAALVFHVAVLVAIGCLGGMRGVTEVVFSEDLLARAHHLTEVTGTVVSYPSLGETYTTFTLRPDTLPADLRVTWFQPPERMGAVVFGDRVRLTGRAELPEAFDGFDYPAYLARRNIFATMTVQSNDLVQVGPSERSVLRAGDALRQRLLGRFAEMLGSEAAAVAQSLLFGDRSALPGEIEDAFSRTGLMHLLAVSGLHLGIVLAGAWFALRWLGLRPRAAYPLVGVLVLLVLWIVGPRISLIRASLLFGFLALGSVLADMGWILRRTIRSLNGLAAAVIVILACQPGSLLDAGFQLTVAATAGILVAFSPLLDLGGWVNRAAGRFPKPFAWLIKPVLSLLAVSAAAQAGAAPVIAWHFGTFHPWALISNLVAIPLAAAALWSGLITAGLAWTPVGGPAARVLGGVLRAFSSTVGGLARLPMAQLPVSRGAGLWMGGLVAFSFLAAFYVRSSSSSTWNSTSMTSGSLGSRPEDLGRLSEPPEVK